MGGGLILGAGGYYPSRWAYNFGLISVRGLIGGGGGGGGGLLSYVLFSR